MKAIETVRAYYNYFNEQNWEGMLSLVDDHIRHEPNQGTPRIGKNLFGEFMKQMDAAYAEELKDMLLFEGEIAGRVAAEFLVHGTYKKAEAGLPEAKGQKYVLPAAAFLEVKNGKITRVTTYYNLEQWISLVS
jgi:steroid delta-isomerase-like uncharacterized protein